jgi:hypothetical protein
MCMIGANPGATMSGLSASVTRTNYFIGNDPTRWRTNVPTFGRVRYENEYPGIDLVFYGHQRALEYDWVVQPGADPSAIELAIDGSGSLELNAHGDLLVHQASGDDVVLHRPVVYQSVRGQQEPVDGGYVIEPDGHVKVWTADFDRRIPLIIDPVLDYATYLGGNSDDTAIAIAVDADGNAYVAGQTLSADFPLKQPLQPSIAADRAAFIAKLNRDGSDLVYATYLGGASGSQNAFGIAVDGTGHAYVTGTTSATNFPVTPGALQVAFGGSSCEDGATCSNAFVVKLSQNGDALEYATFLGGSGEDDGFGIAVDQCGNAYVTGSTGSPDFPFTPGAFQQGRTAPNPYGGTSPNFGAFVAKIARDGSALVYAAFLNDADAYAIAVDASGSAYVTGNAFDDFPNPSDGFPTTPNAFQTTPGYSFITKMTPDGAALAYSTRLGALATNLLVGFFPEELEGPLGIAVDGQGNAYVTGFTFGTDFPTTSGAPFPTAPCNGANNSVDAGTFWADAFVTKINPDGSGLGYSTYLGGCRGDAGSAVAVDAAGNAFVAGVTNSADFPVTSDALQGALVAGTCDYDSCDDAFLINLNAAGTTLVYATFLGGPAEDGANGVAVDSGGHVYLAGTAGGGFPTTRGVYQPLFGGVDQPWYPWPRLSGGGDAFVGRLTFPAPSSSATVATASQRLNVSRTPRTATVATVRVHAPRVHAVRRTHRLKVTVK